MTQSAWLTDNSHLSRLGLKGPLAAAWLQERGLAIPDRANSWISPAPDGQDIVMRLGTAEFFLEQAEHSEQLRLLATELSKPVPGVYPVLREDRALVLHGAAADEVLAQVCNVNFSALRHEREAVMTMMIGVAVIVAAQGNAARRHYRIWCDPSYGDYLLSSLQDVTGTTTKPKSEHVK